MKINKVIILFLGIFAVSLSGCVSGLDEIQARTPDLQGKADGTYRGHYKVGPVSVVVDVEINDKTMTNIAIIKHFNGRGEKAEVITETVIAKQSLAVDAISGATASSKAILKAIENALE
jgi:uncharacterized protein with FMN-binding domain